MYELNPMKGTVMYFKDESKNPVDPPAPPPRREVEHPDPVELPGDTGSSGDNYTEPETYTDPEDRGDLLA